MDSMTRIRLTPRRISTNTDVSFERQQKKRGSMLALLSVALVFIINTSTSWMNSERRDLAQIAEELFAMPLDSKAKKTVFLLGIFSSNSNEEYIHRRTYIRDTYLSVSDPRICKLSEYINQVETNPYKTVCQVPYAFIIAAGDSDRPYDHDDNAPLTISPHYKENDEDDCVYLNIRESMEDGKSSSFFKFGADIADKYNIDYITKLDDDTLVSTELLMNFIAYELPPAPYNRRIFGGRSWFSNEGNVYYGAGQFYFMSSDLAYYVGNKLSAEDRRMLSHSRKTEDADMGKFVFSNDRPIKFIDLVRHKFWMHGGTKSEEDFRSKWENNMSRLPSEGKFSWLTYCT
jgi:hypothetical protein